MANVSFQLNFFYHWYFGFEIIWIHNCRYTTVAHGGKYVIVFVTGDDDENRVYFTDLEKLGKITGKLPLAPVVNGLEASFVVRTA